MVQLHSIFVFQDESVFWLFEVMVQKLSFAVFIHKGYNFVVAATQRGRLHNDLEIYYLQRHDGCFLDLKISNSVMNLLHKCPLFVCSANIANDCL